MNDWILMKYGPLNDRLILYCLRCGDEIEVRLPLSVTTLSILAEGYKGRHKDCKGGENDCGKELAGRNSNELHKTNL